jgi:hypothetical protein
MSIGALGAFAQGLGAGIQRKKDLKRRDEDAARMDRYIDAMERMPQQASYGPMGAMPAGGGGGYGTPGERQVSGDGGLFALIDKTEGGGNYDTLFGHSQRGGRFDGVRVSDMTLAQLSDFASPPGNTANGSKAKSVGSPPQWGGIRSSAPPCAAPPRKWGCPRRQNSPPRLRTPLRIILPRAVWPGSGRQRRKGRPFVRNGKASSMSRTPRWIRPSLNSRQMECRCARVRWALDQGKGARMAGYAVSGFVDGLFKGIGVKHGWEDRKRNQKREDRMDEITSAREARAAEEHARRMRVYDRTDSDWQRGREDDDFFRKTFEGAADATDQAMGGMGAMPPPPQATQPEAGGEKVTTSTQTAPKPPPTGAAPAVAAALGIDPRALGGITPPR